MKMPLLRLVPVIAAAALLVVCAPESERSGVPLELYMSAAFGSKLSSLQASVVSQKGLVPEDKRCIADQVSLDKFVLQEDAAGKLKHAVLFPQTLTSAGGQDLKLKGVTAGKDYTIVIEALSADDPPLLLGSTNFAVSDFQPEENRTENVTLKPFAQLDGGSVLPDGGIVTGSCDRDPRIDK